MKIYRRDFNLNQPISQRIMAEMGDDIIIAIRVIRNNEVIDTEVTIEDEETCLLESTKYTLEGYKCFDFDNTTTKNFTINAEEQSIPLFIACNDLGCYDAQVSPSQPVVSAGMKVVFGKDWNGSASINYGAYRNYIPG